MSQTLARCGNFYKIVALTAKIRLIRVHVLIHLLLSIAMELKS